ncbi:PfkB family carbohydrate kinase [Streptomyces sp. NBC_00448]|uniref:PfkB family carbohydrate kinase n=1 Tax=Streptomyces sp. NBC_00448 TaxID=2903652 RepID=UPI002E23AC4F
MHFPEENLPHTPPERRADGRSAGSGEVLVVGSVNLDLGYRLERLPREGETVRASGSFQAGGGKGANQALAARRLGARVALLASVGRDAGPALADLAAAGVDLTPVLRHEETVTGAAVLLVGPNDNCIVVDAGANDLLRAEHVCALATSTEPPAVVVTNHEVPASVVEATVRAYAGRARVLLNPSPARVLDPELLALVDVLVLNAGELADLLGLGPTPPTPEAVTAILERSALGDCVVTLGRGGAVVSERGAITYVPAFRVDAIDTVGAGDAFLGALAAGLAAGQDLGAAAVRACAAAALAVTAPGARGAALSEGSVDALMAGEPAMSRN